MFKPRSLMRLREKRGNSWVIIWGPLAEEVIPNRRVNWFEENGQWRFENDWAKGESQSAVVTTERFSGPKTKRQVYFEFCNESLTGSVTEIFMNDELHCEDGPARIIELGEERWLMWYISGLLHRIDAPAIERYEESTLIATEWYVRNEAHRLDGPAVEYVGGMAGYQIVHGSETGDKVKDWYFRGNKIPKFAEYYNENDLGDSVMQYARENKAHLKLIEKLARANNWLSEEKLLVLTCADMFSVDRTT